MVKVQVTQSSSQSKDFSVWLKNRIKAILDVARQDALANGPTKKHCPELASIYHCEEFKDDIQKRYAIQKAKGIQDDSIIKLSDLLIPCLVDATNTKLKPLGMKVRYVPEEPGITAANLLRNGLRFADDESIQAFKRAWASGRIDERKLNIKHKLLSSDVHLYVSFRPDADLCLVVRSDIGIKFFSFDFTTNQVLRERAKYLFIMRNPNEKLPWFLAGGNPPEKQTSNRPELHGVPARAINKNNWDRERNIFIEALKNGWSGSVPKFVEQILIKEHKFEYPNTKQQLIEALRKVNQREKQTK